MRSEMLESRLAADHDLEQIAEMRWDYRGEVSRDRPDLPKAEFVRNCADFLRRGLAEGRWACWVAIEEGMVVCVMCIQVIERIPKPAKLRDRYGYLTNVYTRPGYRGKGIGSRLLEEAVEWARGQDLGLLLTWPAEGRQRFYERAGFEATGGPMECPLRAHIG
jgi:GNAT superfamily N-acetyltransferase